MATAAMLRAMIGSTIEELIFKWPVVARARVVE